ncbi:unnamed protein product [Calicophoron daubneyi]|uniref:Transcriptional coactivator p15 (PC4) C-terminal domain-containing protein n=1 Tax=Calicophoron daubneyi TaxID=300641 RepID=A0AAV2U0C4_CALDB
MSSTKRKLAEDKDSEDSLSDLDESPPKKKTEDKNAKERPAKSSFTTTNADGDKMIDLTGKKYVTVRQFKGRSFVDIREFYEDKASGDLKPGRKGISLNIEQWDYLKNVMNEIDDAIVAIHR